MSVGRLRELREERGETRRDVAMATGLTENSIFLLERGDTSDPRLSTVKALSEHYGVPIDRMVELEEFSKEG